MSYLQQLTSKISIVIVVRLNISVSSDIIDYLVAFDVTISTEIMLHLVSFNSYRSLVKKNWIKKHRIRKKKI